MITCTFENGDKVRLRHVTVNAILLKEGKVLLEKRGTYNGKPIVESGKWALIGGFFDRDETLEQALKREVEEETGWKIDNLKLFRLNDSPHRRMEDRQNVDIIFIAEALSQTPTTTEEVTNLEWFGLDSLPEKNQIAFDHGDSLELYRKFLKEEFPLPVLG